MKTAGSGLEADGGTWWSFTVTVPFVPADHWKAEYFGNTTLSGTPVATVDEGTGFVDHSWGTGGPANLTDDFSARFTRTVTWAAGTYRFTVITDDGSRLWIDDQPTIAAWWDQGPTTYTVDVALSAGEHTLRYEYYEHTGGATARLTWELRTPVVLASGASLGENETRVSLDGAYRLQYQGDGNLVVVRLADDTCAWSSQTNNTSVGATMMQGDGNLVIYNGDWAGIWSTGTWGHDGARLEIVNDEMMIVAPDGATQWSASLAAEPEPPSSAAGVSTGAVPPAPTGTAPGAAGFLAFVVGLIGLATRFLRRWAQAPRSQAASGEPHVGRRLWARLPATALLLAAMLVIPATALAQTATQVIEYYHTDALGSVRAVTKHVNGAWTVAVRHDYMPFGEEVAAPVPPQDKRLFTGKERDNETGQDYFGARYYRADVGRFTTIDPLMTIEENLVDPQRWNRYAYARNNPLTYVDPSGLAIELLGNEDERKRALGVLQEGVGGTAGSRLYINAVTSGDTTRYFVGIQGSVDEFKGLAGNVSSSLGDLILNKNVVEFGLTNQDLSRFGGGATYGPGEAGDNANVRVLINPAQISIGESRLSPNSLLGAAKWDPGEVRGLTMPITAWHEFGHAWGGIHGRLPISPATNAEALTWENYMRLATYGAFGPHNARRKIH